MASSSAVRPLRLVLSCEHGGHAVPPRWAHCFAGAERVLASHRGYDRGTLDVAMRMAQRLGAPLVAHRATRLLVDANRSEHHPRCFSRYTRDLGARERERILERVYRPHRARVEREVRSAIASGHRAVHVAVHSFTPVLGGERRRADLGLLYDPRRAAERAFCARWRDRLRAADSSLRVRRNYPYHGRADGLTTALRRVFSDERYLGIELEVNQRFARDPARLRALADLLSATLVACLRERPR